jgi:hypothetical protein
VIPRVSLRLAERFAIEALSGFGGNVEPAMGAPGTPTPRIVPSRIKACPEIEPEAASVLSGRCKRAVIATAATRAVRTIDAPKNPRRLLGRIQFLLQRRARFSGL